MDTSINISLLITLGSGILSIGVIYGVIKTTMKNFEEKLQIYQDDIKKDLGRLEKKQDQHNGLIERMVTVEQSTRSAHHRIDGINSIEKPLEKIGDAMSEFLMHLKGQ